MASETASLDMLVDVDDQEVNEHHHVPETDEDADAQLAFALSTSLNDNYHDHDAFMHGHFRRFETPEPEQWEPPSTMDLRTSGETTASFSPEVDQSYVLQMFMKQMMARVCCIISILFSMAYILFHVRKSRRTWSVSRAVLMANCVTH